MMRRDIFIHVKIFFKVSLNYPIFAWYYTCFSDLNLVEK